MVKHIWEMTSKNLNYLRSALSLGTVFEAFFFFPAKFFTRSVGGRERGGGVGVNSGFFLRPLVASGKRSASVLLSITRLAQEIVLTGFYI